MYEKQGINPCCIVQISNESKAENELKEVIKVAIEKDWQYVCFVEKEKDYETNETNTRLGRVKKPYGKNM